MRAIEISSYGAPKVLRVCERTVPQPQKGEVLIKVAAAGINRPDVLQRQGKYPVPPGVTDIPGLEVAGTIVEGDTQDSNFRLGDSVCALIAGGGYAEYCIASIAHCLPIPHGLTLIQAASLPETFFTVWSNLFDQAKLKFGESILIHGGSSGIGVAAIQLAKSFGATVYITAGDARKCQACLELGADKAINYREQDFTAEIQRLTHNKGVNLILDMVGADYIQRNIDSLALEGRLAIIALQKGTKAEVNFGAVLLKRLTIFGSTLRPRAPEFKANIARHLLAQVWPLFSVGKIRPVVDQVFPFDQAVYAHDYMEQGQHIGKLVLAV